MKPCQATKVVNLTPPAAIIDDASATVAELDTKGWNYAQLYFILGATDIAMTALAVTESDATGSGHANVTGLVWGTSTDIDGSTSVLPSATDDNTVFRADVNMVGRKRFLDVTATCGNGSAGTYITIIAILSEPDIAPITSAGCGCNQVCRV